jgi:hypothetical protein
MTDQNPATKCEFGVDPKGAIGATRVMVDLADLIGQWAWRMTRGDGDRLRQA